VEPGARPSVPPMDSGRLCDPIRGWHGPWGRLCGRLDLGADSRAVTATSSGAAGALGATWTTNEEQEGRLESAGGLVATGSGGRQAPYARGGELVLRPALRHSRARHRAGDLPGVCGGPRTTPACACVCLPACFVLPARGAGLPRPGEALADVRCAAGPQLAAPAVVARAAAPSPSAPATFPPSLSALPQTFLLLPSRPLLPWLSPRPVSAAVGPRMRTCPHQVMRADARPLLRACLTV
jgi:hypothetical protein